RLLQAKRFAPQLHNYVMPAQLTGQAGSFFVYASAERRNVNVRLAEHGIGRFAQGHHQPIFSNRESNARSGRTAERLRKPVIAAASEDCVLGTQCCMRELKCSASVVIQTADKTVV